MRELLAAGCGWECVDCGISLAAYGLSIFSLLAACGASFMVNFSLVATKWEIDLLDRLREAGLNNLEISALNLEEIYGYVIRVARAKNGTCFNTA